MLRMIKFTGSSLKYTEKSETFSPLNIYQKEETSQWICYERMKQNHLYV